MTLTAKQQAFVAEYLIELNATQAAIRAGYSAATANRIGAQLLTKPAVAEAVARAQAERAERTKIDADYVLRQAVKLHERCMQEVEPFTDRKGDQVIDKDGNPLFVFNAAGAAKALELVGKHVSVQAFRDQVGVGNPDGSQLGPTVIEIVAATPKAESET